MAIEGRIFVDGEQQNVESTMIELGHVMAGSIRCVESFKQDEYELLMVWCRPDDLDGEVFALHLDSKKSLMGLTPEKTLSESLHLDTIKPNKPFEREVFNEEGVMAN